MVFIPVFIGFFGILIIGKGCQQAGIEQGLMILILLLWLIVVSAITFCFKEYIFD